MARITLHAEGRAAVDTAWERYAQPARWATWSPQVRAVHASAERIEPGLRGEVVSLLGVRAQFRVDHVDEAARRWDWTVRLGPATVRLRHDVEPSERGSRTGLVIEGPLLVITAYAPLAQVALGRLVRA